MPRHFGFQPVLFEDMQKSVRNLLTILAVVSVMTLTVDVSRADFSGSQLLNTIKSSVPDRQLIDSVDSFFDPVSQLSLDIESAGNSQASPTRNNIVELPPAPNSAALFLSALLSVGAYQLARNARHFSLSHLPEWYHPGAPDQIGGSFVFDLNPICKAVCVFEDVDWALRRGGVYKQPPELYAHFDSQYDIAPTAPRAPPALSL